MIELLPDRQVMKEPLKGDFGREFLMNDTFYRRVHVRKRPLRMHGRSDCYGKLPLP